MGRMVVLGGKVTKQTRFGKIAKDRLSRAVRSAALCNKEGLAYHVIDAEWKWNYLHDDEVAELIENSGSTKTVLTFSSRHLNSLRIMRQSLGDLGTSGNVAVGLVAGNRAYLSWREIRRPVSRSLRDFAAFSRRNFPGMPVFIGTEGIPKTSSELAPEFDLIPFLLLGNDTEAQIERFRREVNVKDVAVYVPFLVSSNYPRMLRDILFRLGGYILRRRWVQEELGGIGYKMDAAAFRSIVQEKQPLPDSLLESKLGEILERAAKVLALWGTEVEVVERLRNLSAQGATILAGLPIKENDEQVTAFASCVRKLNE
jgi:hypothetical protein